MALITSEADSMIPTLHTARFLAVALVLCLTPPLSAHAVLVEASPPARASVSGPDIDVRLRFNSRIDGPRSRVDLVLPDKSVRELVLETQPAPEVLTSRARGLAAGAYRLRWQVLASDGHITRGEYAFSVK
jgi:methionine-rich copper-binding protein CopC